MENTDENHGKFRAQYFLQNVFVDAQGVKHILDACYLGFKFLRDGSYLELKPLSMISDQDAFKVAEMICYDDFTPDKIINKESYWKSITILGYRKDNIEIEIQIYKNGDLYGHFSKIENDQYYSLNYSNAYGYLRSKGYALPYLGISVEKQIEFGWVKLKTK